MKNFGKGAIRQDESSSSNEEIELSPLAKSMVDELRTWMDNRLQERLEALNENVQPTNNGPNRYHNTVFAPNFEWPKQQNEKLEQAVTNTEQFTQNIATLVKGITQRTTTRGIEMGQGSGNIGENQP